MTLARKSSVPEAIASLRARALPATLAFATTALLAGGVAEATPVGEAATPGRAGRIAAIGHYDYVDVFTITATGKGARQRVTRNEYAKTLPNWSPDGREVAYIETTSASGRDVFVSSADGRKRRRLTWEEEVFFVSWSHDGSRLLINVADAADRDRTWVMDADGRNRRLLFRDRGYAQWSPDGGLIAFGNGGLFVSTPDGRGERLLTRNGGEYEWLPDGSGVAIYRKDIELVTRDGKEGGTLFRIARPNTTSHFSLSPDGRAVAFNDDLDPGNGPEQVKVFVQNDDGSAARLIAENLDYPDWQPVCTHYGTAGNDVIRGTAGRDVICGLAGNDRVVAGAGDDVIQGGSGNDWIDGGDGADWLFGGAGDDVLIGRYHGRDIVDGGPGRDRATADPRADTRRDLERTTPSS